MNLACKRGVHLSRSDSLTLKDEPPIVGCTYQCESCAFNPAVGKERLRRGKFVKTTAVLYPEWGNERQKQGEPQFVENCLSLSFPKGITVSVSD